MRTRPPLRCALLNVTAAPQTTPRLRSADNERINMYIPSQVNARQHSNFTAQSRVEAPCTGTSKTVSPLDNEGKYKSELLSGPMSDRQDDESQEGNREVGRDKNTRVNSAESDQRRGLLWWKPVIDYNQAALLNCSLTFPKTLF